MHRAFSCPPHRRYPARGAGHRSARARRLVHGPANPIRRAFRPAFGAFLPAPRAINLAPRAPGPATRALSPARRAGQLHTPRFFPDLPRSFLDRRSDFPGVPSAPARRAGKIARQLGLFAWALPIGAAISAWRKPRQGASTPGVFSSPATPDARRDARMMSPFSTRGSGRGRACRPACMAAERKRELATFESRQ
jgi:hypothetical protein